MSQIGSNIGSEYGYDIGFVKHENEGTNVSQYQQIEVVSELLMQIGKCYYESI